MGMKVNALDNTIAAFYNVCILAPNNVKDIGQNKRLFLVNQILIRCQNVLGIFALCSIANNS